MVNVRAAIIETREIFSNSVWPIWRDRLGSAELISVEGSEKSFERRADAGGIDDFFAKRANGIIIPIASRIEFATSPDVERSRQLCPRFTIRSAKHGPGGSHENTELKRLISAWKDPVERRYLPYRTFQTFVKRWPHGVEVLYSSSICTLELCKYIHLQSENGKLDSTKTREGDATFMRVYVDALLDSGVHVETYHS